MIRDLGDSRELAWRLFVRDMSARYRQSFLGYVWAFLPPITTTCTFLLLTKSGVFSGNVPAIPYPLYLIVGTILWQLFADAISSPIKTVAAAKPMLAKINFPREAILLSGLYDVLFNFAVRASLLVPVYFYYHLIPPWSALLALGAMAALVCLGFMIGILLTPVGMLYTDIGQALTLVLSFWMLLTPVVYEPPAKGALALLTKFNPVSPLLVTGREWLTVGAATQLPLAAAVTAGTLVCLLAGWIIYRLAMPILVERMGG
jgi:lipopolysaccharide transport system permease protein